MTCSIAEVNRAARSEEVTVGDGVTSVNVADEQAAEPQATSETTEVTTSHLARRVIHLTKPPASRNQNGSKPSNAANRLMVASHQVVAQAD
jgi:hypothetical protein